MKHKELNQRLSNYIRIHRKNAGLSQGELGGALGYCDEQTIARHERFHVMPPLRIAISYAIVFRIPVAELFAGLHDEVELGVETRLAQLEQQLGQRSARDGTALITARKLLWLSQRKNPEYRIHA